MDFEDFYRVGFVPKTPSEPSESDEDIDDQIKIMKQMEKEEDELRDEDEGIMYKDDLRKLMHYVLYSHNYRKSSEWDPGYIHACSALLGWDYRYQALDNRDESLCPDYPTRLWIPIEEVGARPAEVAAAPRPLGFAAPAAEPVDIAAARPADIAPPGLVDARPGTPPPWPEIEELFDNLFDMVVKSRRVRRDLRFPVPVILFQGKYICRSAALHENVASEWKENIKVDRSFTLPHFRYGMNVSTAHYLLLTINFTKAVRRDVEALRFCNVGYIADLREECTAKRFSEVVNSSEDYYARYYRRFEKACIPYPEIPFFVAYHEHRNVEELIYDWPQNWPTADLQLPVNLTPTFINYNNYKDWRVIRLTQNYLLLLLNYITLGNKGLLVHCSDGQDRTSLFISLLRLSLWADGLIHKKLKVVDIIYFTVAYDWFLFGHDFPLRLHFHLEIMRFCFDCLPYIVSEEFAKVPQPQGAGTSVTKREARLMAVWKVFMKAYNEAYDVVVESQMRRARKRRAEAGEA